MTTNEIAQAVGPLVVGLGRGARGGSGVIADRGRILTLAHNLRGEDVEVLYGGATHQATVVAQDPDLDLALLAADGLQAPSEPRWASGAAPAIGAPVWALGDPGGGGLRVTEGAISAAPLRLRGRRGRPIEVLEHTAPLPRGSGGGPLVDADGALVGLNALRQRGGLILALPAAEVSARMRALLEGRGVPQPPRLGLALLPPRAARRLRRSVGLDERDGLLVRGVDEDGPAARAGVRRGDLLVGLGGRALTSVDELYAAVDELTPGAETPLAVVRGAEELELALLVPAEGEEPR